MRRLAAVIIALSMVSAMMAQTLPQKKKRAVYGIDSYVSPSALDYSGVARQITAGATSKYDMAKALYLWLCENIEFDRTAQLRTADDCWKHRRAVCQGYCELFYRMGETVGLKSHLVFGKCKHGGAGAALIEHTWLSVETERGDILIDPTWGAGSLVNGRFVRMAEPMIWFDANPYWLIFTHMPKSRKHQHLDDVISEEKFMQLPYMTPLTECFGVKAHEALQMSLEGKEPFPIIPVLNAPYLRKIMLEEVPDVQHLQCGETYTFTIRKLQPELKLCIENEGSIFAEPQWTQNEDGSYSISVTPTNEGRLHVVVSMVSNFIPLNKVILEYEVLPGR